MFKLLKYILVTIATIGTLKASTLEDAKQAYETAKMVVLGMAHSASPAPQKGCMHCLSSASKAETITLDLSEFELPSMTTVMNPALQKALDALKESKLIIDRLMPASAVPTIEIHHSHDSLATDASLSSSASDDKSTPTFMELSVSSEGAPSPVWKQRDFDIKLLPRKPVYPSAPPADSFVDDILDVASIVAETVLDVVAPGAAPMIQKAVHFVEEVVSYEDNERRQSIFVRENIVSNDPLAQQWQDLSLSHLQASIEVYRRWISENRFPSDCGEITTIISLGYAERELQRRQLLDKGE